jgi:hypothetical protein
VGELRRLRRCCRSDLGVGVPDGGYTNAAAQVDELVAVDIDQDRS